MQLLGPERPPSVQLLHEFLRAEHGYEGSYKAVRKFVRARRPAPDPPVPAGRDSTRGPNSKRLGRVPPVDLGDAIGDDGLRLRHGPQPLRKGGRRLESLDGPARLASRPQ
jgi:hypothetical protein